MTFLVNGASFTSGKGLEYPDLNAWPAVFGQKMNVPIVNVSKGGSSVDYIVYSTIKELSLNDYKNVIVAWPSLRRLMLIRRENSYFLHTGLVDGHFYRGGYIYTDTYEFKEYVKLYYKYWSNELYDLKMSLQQIILLQEYLKNRGCNYLFLNSNSFKLHAWLNLSRLDCNNKRRLVDGFDEFNDDQIVGEEIEIQSLYNQLDLKHYHDPINFNLTDWCIKSAYLDTVNKHPTVDGQIRIAEYIRNVWSKIHSTNEEL